MKEYIVIKDILNIRSKPSDESDDTYVGQLLKGDHVWLNEDEVIGTTPKGGTSNIWRGDNYNRFVASEAIIPNSVENRKVEFAKAVNDFWLLSKGENTKIALLDYGVASSHLFLSKNITHKKIPGDGEPTDKHGTRMAGLLSGFKNDVMVGLAPSIQIIDYKIETSDGENTFGNFQNFLKDIKDKNVNIISISFEFINDGHHIPSFDEMKDTDNIIKSIVEQGKIIVAATGNKNYVAYPGSNNDVITVGALKDNVPVNFIDEDYSNKLLKNPDCFIELFEWPFCGLENSISNDNNINSSEATAAVSALIALKIGKNPSLKSKEIKEHIKASSTLLPKIPGLDILKLNVSNFLNS